MFKATLNLKLATLMCAFFLMRLSGATEDTSVSRGVGGITFEGGKHNGTLKRFNYYFT